VTKSGRPELAAGRDQVGLAVSEKCQNAKPEREPSLNLTDVLFGSELGAALMTSAPNQAQGMMAQMLELLSVQRKAARVKKMYAQFDEWKKQQQVQRRYRMGTNL
jgi:hypothetical protein